MARVVFTSNLARHLPVPDLVVAGGTLREVFDATFAVAPALRGYVLDDQGAIRKHVAVFVGGAQVRDRSDLSIPVGPEAEVFVLQALSGG